MAKELQKEMRPKGITCPEGIWLIQAALLYSNKINNNEGDKIQIGDIIEDFVDFLVITAELEVFNINCYSGKKRAVKREYMRGVQFKDDLISQLEFYLNRSEFKYSYEECTFVNKEQFANYLDDKPIQPMNVDLADRPTKQSANLNSDKPLGTRERNTLQKIILGMAIKGYAYSPEASKSSVPREISDDLALLGLEVSAETVRNYLQQAYSEFPVSTEKHD